MGFAFCRNRFYADRLRSCLLQQLLTGSGTANLTNDICLVPLQMVTFSLFSFNPLDWVGHSTVASTVNKWPQHLTTGNCWSLTFVTCFFFLFTLFRCKNIFFLVKSFYFHSFFALLLTSFLLQYLFFHVSLSIFFMLMISQLHKYWLQLTIKLKR